MPRLVLGALAGEQGGAREPVGAAVLLGELGGGDHPREGDAGRPGRDPEAVAEADEERGGQLRGVHRHQHRGDDRARRERPQAQLLEVVTILTHSSDNCNIELVALTMLPDPAILPDVLPTERLNARGVARPAVRAEYHRIPDLRNAVTVAGALLQTAGVVVLAARLVGQR